MINNKSCLGYDVGFSLFAIQTIIGDHYRNNKQRQHNNKMKLLLSGTKDSKATIRSIVPEEEFIKKRYIVQKNGEDVITEKKRASTPRRTQLFFGTELQKVDTNSKELITTDDMEKLNKIQYEKESRTSIREESY